MEDTYALAIHRGTLVLHLAVLEDSTGSLHQQEEVVQVAASCNMAAKATADSGAMAKAGSGVAVSVETVVRRAGIHASDGHLHSGLGTAAGAAAGTYVPGEAGQVDLLHSTLPGDDDVAWDCWVASICWNPLYKAGSRGSYLVATATVASFEKF